MKSKAITRIVIFSIVILLLLSILLAGLSSKIFIGGISFGSTLNNGTVQSKGEVAASDIRNLNIGWVSGSVTFQTADTDRISFYEDGFYDYDETMVWSQSGDTLTLQFSNPRSFFGLNFGITSTVSKDLVVTVPEDWNCADLNIESVSADVSITGMNADDVSLESVSGKLSMSGSVSNLSVDCVSADCDLWLSAGVRTIDMDGVSGDMTLYLPEEQGFTVSFDGISGNISTDFPTTVSDRTHTYGDGSCDIEVDGISGDINIKKLS